MATAHETFTYSPLPTGEDAIRNLTVEAGDFFEPLICTLTPVTFSAKPGYVALSYTWADPYLDNVTLPTSPVHVGSSPQLSTNMADFQGRQESLPSRDGERTPSAESNNNQSETLSSIMLNGCPFHIQHNLYLALLHLRSLTHPLTLWVDSICINQSDTLERSSQVAMMSFIYRRAIKVVAWLGIKDYHSRLDLFRRMANDWKAGRGHQFAASVAGRTEFHGSSEPDDKTLVRLAKSAYWTRLWVTQEVSLARTLVFLYGPKIWTYEDLRQWEVLKVARTRPLPMKSTSDGGSDAFEAMLRLLDTRDARHSEEMKLESLIERFAKSACSDLRDRVYGLLGLANDIRPVSEPEGSKSPLEKPVHSLNLQIEARTGSRRSIRTFKVDYSRSCYDIWTDVIEFLLLQKHTTGVRSNSDTDLEIERQINVVRAAGVVQEALGQQVEKAIHENPSVRAVGFLCGEIVQLGPSCSSLIASFHAQQDWYSCWEEYYHISGDLELLREKDERYTSRILAFSDNDLSRIQDIRSPETVAWHVAGGNRPDTSDSSYALEYSKIWDIDQRQQGPNSPRICLGTEYLIATVPPSARPGDVVVRFRNCSAAIVMRPMRADVTGNTASSFILIGRVDVADDISRAATPEADNIAWDEVERGFEASTKVYLDLNFRVLQFITAAIST